LLHVLKKEGATLTKKKVQTLNSASASSAKKKAEETPVRDQKNDD